MNSWWSAHGVDRFGQIGQVFDYRRDRRACRAIGLVVEQASFARGGNMQRDDQRVAVFGFQIRTAGVETFETISFDHSLIGLMTCDRPFVTALERFVVSSGA